MTPGTHLGNYEVVALIGKGGMGEVYRARDTKLQRDVAIKVLPALFARDPERLARFEREARTLAALNHAGIAHIYGIVELPAGGHGLVMEFVDGEDLGERISRTGAIPLDEAIPIARQITEAVEAAHEHGIIHRDLKPANVKLRADGQIKVLDFGLAKALAPVDPAAPAANIENSPTITSPFQMSQLGVILGTAAYMAPEQAKGKPVDRRVDIWAFGCVLYEMLTGTRPFGGEDVTDTLAAIVRADPDWSVLPPDTPANIRTLLRRCLEKDRRERLPDIGAARLELKDGASHPAAPAVAPPARTTPSKALPWIMFAVAAIAAIAALAYALRPRVEPETRVVKSTVMPPSPLSSAPALRLNISPDGRRIAFVATNAQGRSIVWVRALDSLVAQPIAGTLDAQAPFWSADSRWIAFFADGKLKKVDPASGVVLSICEAGAAPPGTWNRDDVILFTQAQAIARVAATGGKPEDVTTMRPGEQTHISPFFLPDGRHFLYTVSGAGATRPGVFVTSLDKGEPKQILDFASNTFYANGYLLFVRDGTLMAQPFDAATFSLSGSAAPIAEGIQMNPNTGSAAFSASTTGVLVYQTGVSAGTQLMWFDRSGRPLEKVGDQRGYRDIQLSPDGKRASVTIIGARSATGDVWLLDLGRKLRQRFTFNELTDAAVWSPDGRSLVFRRSAREGLRGIGRMAASGSGTEERLLTADVEMIPLGFSPDGTMLLYRQAGGAATGPVFLLPLTGERKPRPLLDGDRAVSSAAVSPDGKWLAYASGWSGRRDIYVTSFPGGVGKWQISSEGGDNPVWRADGKELFYFSNDRLMAVDVSPSTDRFDTGPERTLFSVHVPSATLGTRSTYAATADGQKFLVNTWDAGAAIDPLTLVINWPASIK